MKDDDADPNDCPKCGSDRVAIESLPLNDDPATLVCRSCGYVFEAKRD